MIVRETTLHVKNVKANSEPGLLKKWILIAIALGFLGIFILVPLIAVFTEGLNKGIELYFASLTERDALSAIKLTLLTAAVTIPVNTIFGVLAAWVIAK